MISPTNTKYLNTMSKGFGLLGLGSSIYGAINEGMSTQKAYNKNASMLDEQGNVVSQAKDLQLARTKKDYEKLRGAQEAGYAKAGVALSGSPLEVMLDSAKEYELDKSITEYNYKIQEARLKNQANMERYYGRIAKQQAMSKIPTLVTQMGGLFS